MRKRNCSVLIRFTEKELEQLDRNVKKTGLTRESYIRTVLDEKTPKELPPMDFYDIMKELRQINNNMNQLAFRANAYGEFDRAEYRLNADELQKAIGTIMGKVFE